MTGLKRTPEPRASRLTAALALLLLPTGCQIGLEVVGGDDEVGTTDTSGDGDTTTTDTTTGDGDTTTDTTTGDGDTTTDTSTDTTGDGDTGTDTDTGTTTGDGDCPPIESALEYHLLLDGDDPDAITVDEQCTLGQPLQPDPTVLELECPSFTFNFGVTATPAVDFSALSVGSPAHLRMHTTGPAPAPLWLRVDFPEDDASVFFIHAGQIEPDPNEFYFPPPWDLGVVDSCGPVDDGCAVTEGKQLGLGYEGQTLELWAGEHGSIEVAENNGVEAWVGKAFEILDISPVCDPAPGFFLTYQTLIMSMGKPVETDICEPGLVDPCATGLHCCYPCGIMGCDFVCTPEDPISMECPPPPP